MTKSKSIIVAVFAVFTALVVVFYAIPFVFLLPVIIMIQLYDMRASIYISAVFGITSLIFSFILPGTVSIAFTMFPWVAIIPRLFIGPASRLVYTGLLKLKANRTLASASAAAAAIITNSGLVIGFFALFHRNATMGATAMTVLIPQMLVSAVIELAACTVLAPIIMYAIIKAGAGKRSLSISTVPQTNTPQSVDRDLVTDKTQNIDTNDLQADTTNNKMSEEA